MAAGTDGIALDNSNQAFTTLLIATAGGFNPEACHSGCMQQRASIWHMYNLTRWQKPDWNIFTHNAKVSVTKKYAPQTVETARRTNSV
jgi:hypothetical protein